MAYKLKPVQCFNCIYFFRDAISRSEGKCKKDGRYTREHRVCNLLPTNQDRRDAKINQYAKGLFDE